VSALSVNFIDPKMRGMFPATWFFDVQFAMLG